MENSINIFKNKLNEHNKDIDYKNVITTLKTLGFKHLTSAVKFHLIINSTFAQIQMVVLKSTDSWTCFRMSDDIN